MRNFELKQILKMQETIRRQIEPFSAAIKSIEADHSGIRAITKHATRQHELLRAAVGPAEELLRFQAPNISPDLRAQFQEMQSALDQMTKQFKVPDVAAVQIIQEFERSGGMKAIKQAGEHATQIQSAMDAMSTPWFNTENPNQSIAGFIELQNIGLALRTTPAFDPTLADRLRVDLGDWREKIDWPEEVFTDPLTRTEFYSDRGLDSALTTFPSGAFNQSVTIAEIKQSPPPFVATYDYEPDTEGDEDDAGFARTNAAHDRLQRFESQLRKFIDERMTDAFGSNWIKQQVPGEISANWRKKREKARDNGEPDHPLIAYADFTDYVPIITRKDNWQAVFEPLFKRTMLVQESFQRLYPIRICTMHARIITQDDELYLYTETRRLLSVIGIAR